MIEPQPAWRSFASVGTLVSGLFSVAVWGLLYGWEAGAWLVLLLYLHESGHVLVAHWRRLPVVQAPVFIPGLGAVVMVGGEQHPWDAALLSLGGPVVGAAAALVAKLVGVALDLPVLAFAGDFGLLLNLLNLLPIPLLDGGRLGRLSGWFVLVTATVIGLTTTWFGVEWIMAVAVVGAGLQVVTSWGVKHAAWLPQLGIALSHLLALSGLFAAYFLSPRVPWVRIQAGVSTELVSSLMTFMTAAFLLSWLLWRWTWAPGRHPWVRYPLLALLGWAQWVWRDPRLVVVAWCGMAHLAGLPGLQWLDRRIRSFAAQGSVAAGFALAVGFDLRCRSDRAEADAWLDSMLTALQGSDWKVYTASNGDLLLLGHEPAANRSLLAGKDLLDPDKISFAWINNLAWALYKAGRVEEALPLARRLADSQRGGFLDTLGQVLLAAGEAVEAEAVLRQALKLSSMVGTRIALAEALAAQGRFREAVATAETAFGAPSPWPVDAPTKEAVRARIGEWRARAQGA
jgi:hypothetical protein